MCLKLPFSFVFCHLPLQNSTFQQNDFLIGLIMMLWNVCPYFVCLTAKTTMHLTWFPLSILFIDLHSFQTSRVSHLHQTCIHTCFHNMLFATDCSLEKHSVAHPPVVPYSQSIFLQVRSTWMGPGRIIIMNQVPGMTSISFAQLHAWPGFLDAGCQQSLGPFLTTTGWIRVVVFGCGWEEGVRA